MAYGEFNMPILQGLLARAKQDEEDEAERTLAQLMTPQPPVEQPEPQSGTDMVNEAVRNAMPRPAPNPYEINSQRQVLAQKQLYNDAKDDAGRQMASSMADFIRNNASAAGLDMSGYGADVSLNDAYKNLASREAQDVIEALQGQYSMNSDQYYERKYDEALMRGLSRNQAKRLAGAQAREYQANRVAYLQGAYNSYGRDGRVTNDYGNQFLAMMAMENPTLANFYAQVYPNQKEAFTRDNQLEDKVLDQTNVLARMAEMFRYNQAGEDLRAIRESEKEQEKDARNWANTYKATELADKQKEIEYNRLDRQLNTWADRLGLAGYDRERFIAKGYGVSVPEDKKADNSLAKMAEKQLESLTKQAEVIQKALDSATMSDEDKQIFRQSLQGVQADINEINQLLGDALGLNPQIPDYTGDEAQDLQTIRSMLGYIANHSAGGNLSNENAFAAIRKWANKTQEGEKLSDDEIKALIAKAVAR